MRIIAAAGEFNLPTNFETQLTKYNVMLTTSGEQTNPITLPPTPNNLKLVGYSNRIDAYYKPLRDIPVTVYNGISVRQANLGIHTSDEDDGISCTLYFGTGDLYSKFEDAKLASLPWPVVKSPNYDEETSEEQVQYLIDLLKTEYNTENSTADFFCQPLLTDKVVTKKNENGSYSENIVLNGLEAQKYTYLPLPGTQSYVLGIMEGEYEQIYVEDSVDIYMTKGYGMTPFLRLKYVVNTLFSYYGYTFDYSDFASKTRSDIWDYTAILNNVADAIYTGILKYAQLLPDMTIKEFLTNIEVFYAARFIVNEKNKQVKFIRFSDVFNDTDLTDLSPYLSSKIKRSDFNPIKCVLKIDNSNTVETNDSVVKTEEIKIPFLNYKELTNEYTGLPGSVTIEMTCIKTIIHKNTSVVVDNKIVKDEDKSTNELWLCDFDSELWYTKSAPIGGWTVKYRRSKPLLSVETIIYQQRHIYSLDLSIFNTWYNELFNFKLNSNIPLTAKFNLPTTVLESLDISKPVLLNNQKMLIHTLKHDIEDKNAIIEVEAELRTMRPYADR